jgi:hypothetical protein
LNTTKSLLKNIQVNYPCLFDLYMNHMGPRLSDKTREPALS